MRTGRELIIASIPYSKEKKSKSWVYTLSTLALLLLAVAGTLNPFHWSLQLISSIICGLLMVKFFIIYHDYNHHAILKNSKVAHILMSVFGILILAPIKIWKRTHDYHHFNNSKLSNNGVGSYPLLDITDFNKLSKGQKFIYLASRHPLTIFFGYISLFIFDFNIKTFIQSPKKHWNALLAIIIHAALIVVVTRFLGLQALAFTILIPFLISNGMGAYLFYAQHNFPGAIYVNNKDWDYTTAAIKSTSFLKMGSLMNWFTGNIGYHHVHHLNHHIPFYRLKEGMAGIPEMQNPITTTLWPKDVYACLRLKVWDSAQGKMTNLKGV